MVRPRLPRALVAVASVGLVASSLVVVPAAAEQDSGSTAIPTPSSSPSAEPTVEPSPAPSPSLTPSPDESAPTVEPTSPPTQSASPPMMETASPSPTVSDSAPTSPIAEGEVSEKIVRLTDEQYLQPIAQRIEELGGEIFQTYDAAIQGYAARLSAKDALVLAESDGVAGIEENLRINLESSAIRTDSFCTTESLGKIDDGGTLGVPLTFDVNWFGRTYTEVLVNNNGGVSFNDGAGQFRSYNGINLNTVDRPLVLPLFTDIDTRNVAASAVTYGSGSIGGAPAFCVNWVDVGEFQNSAPKFSFQLMFIDRSADGNAGDFDIEFNYGNVGQPSSSSNGRFVAGYAVPHSRTDSLVRISATDDPSLYADGGALALISNKYPSSESIPGRYTFPIRPDASGTTPTPDPTPTPIATAGNCDGRNNPSTTLTGYASTYCNVTWGLDRIDQRPLPLNDEFSPSGGGSGVRAYIVDTGLNASHQEFTGRVSAGRNFYTSDGQSSSNTADCNGHGTHVASTTAGSTYGVAKSATVVPLRVFGCSGSTTTAVIISALDWIAANHPSGADGVVNMSLGGGISTSLDQAVQCLTGVGSGCSANNLTVVVAAGNSNAPASSFSPARVDEAITVGSTTSGDTRSSFSNYGSAVDIFAPGSAITAAWIGSSTATATISGTSMASPHVAGAAAVYLHNHPGATADQVLSALVAQATSGAVSNAGFGSPNKLLFIGGLAVVTSVSPSSASSDGGSSVTITGENLDDPTSGTTSVEFGIGNSATVSSETDSAISLVIPSGTAGAVDLIIDNGRGRQTITGAFTYTSNTGTAPNITAVSPNTGPVAGGTEVTISGTNLVVDGEATSVLLGAAPAVVTSSSPSEITARIPGGTAGLTNVTVGTSAGSDSAAFTYVAAPGVTSLDVTSGPIVGGTNVTVVGENLNLTTSVTVGGSTANLGDITSTTVEFATPPRPSATASTYDVILTTPGGSVTITSAFTYVAPPTINSIASTGQILSSAPLGGPDTGGTGVRITGTNLNEVTLVNFGSNSATFTRESSTSLVAISPPGSGTVALSVTSAGGTATLPNAFTYTTASQPPSTVGGDAGSSGTSGGSSSGGASANAPGGGGLNAITTIRPSASGAPGSVIALAGWGLESTRDVRFNDVSTSFTVVSGGHVQVTVPNLPPGTYVIHAVLAPEIGRASFWDGFQVTTATSPSTEVSGTSLMPVKDPSSTSASADAADFITFKSTSTKLTKATRRKLTRMAERFTGADAQVTIVAYTNSNGTAVSNRRANARARAMQDYLEEIGFTGSTRIIIEPGATRLQSRSVLIYAQTASTSAASVRPDGVRSLIVRLKKGRSISVDGKVRGADRVTGPIADSLSIGPYLGLRMYRIDFAGSVSVAVAERVAKELAQDPGIEFAEPDSLVSTQVSIAS